MNSSRIQLLQHTRRCMATMSAKPSSKKVTSRVWERPGTTRYKDPELTAQREREAALTARQQSKAKSGHGPVLVARKTVTLSADESSPFLSSLITPERVKAQWAARQGLDSASHNDPIYYQHGLSHEEVTSMLGELDEPLLSSASQPTSFASASSNKESNLKLFSEQSAKENAKNVLRREIAQRILGLDTMNNAELLKVHIQQAIHHFQRRGPLDSGSADVQVAILTVRIRNLEQHLMGNRRDTANRVKLQHFRDQRRKMLDYLRRESLKRFQWTVNQLGLPVTA